MYSFYRAWLSLGPCGPAFPPPLPPPSPLPAGQSSAPDVALQVGPSMTHFSAHKAILCAHSGFFKAALNNHLGTTPILVPSINVDEFSSLLTFMYTGYLDLNLGNIYNILLATHILHMPRALEICRNFLLQAQNIENRSNVIKPIASRKAPPATQQIFAPTYSNLEKHEDTPFRAVTIDKDAPSTSKMSHENPPPEQENVETKPAAKKGPGEKSKSRKRNPDGHNEKVIIDIACCDGPVRFQRVINKNYNVHRGVGDGDSPRPHHQHQHQHHGRNNRPGSQGSSKSVGSGKTEENLKEKCDENQGQELFTCLYCNHTFKSQYCYQKHARRHLNPVNVDVNAMPAGADSATKREVKLLDMNVQYYPCKTCGSKFPSYYFVHKHRKLCHAEEMADSSNKNNEMLPEPPNVAGVVDSENTSNASSNIDVEAINSDN